jgi:ribosome maturation factor RimP
VGRNVEVTFNDATKKEGQLLEANENEITIGYTEGKGKKMVEHQQIIPFSDIKQTKVLIKF